MSKPECNCELDHVCEEHRMEQELYWTGETHCRDCGTPFNNANALPQGLCNECRAQ